MKKLILTLFLTIIIIQGSLNLPAFALKANAAEDISVQHTEEGIYIFKINSKKTGNRIKPLVMPKLTTVSDVYKNNEKYKLVVNGGFFDPATGGAISYAVINSKTVETPFSNRGLILNLAKQGRLEDVLNRAEFRVLTDKNGKISFDIQPHFVPTPMGKTLKHSLQAGPMVYPYINLEKESFILKDVNGKITFQAADVLKKRERTVLGLKGDEIYLIIFAKQKKVTLNEVHEFCKKMKLEKAMALDGGSSTSLNYKDLEIFSSVGAQRKVKTFLVIEK